MSGQSLDTSKRLFIISGGGRRIVMDSYIERFNGTQLAKDNGQTIENWLNTLNDVNKWRETGKLVYIRNTVKVFDGYYLSWDLYLRLISWLSIDEAMRHLTRTFDIAEPVIPVPVDENPDSLLCIVCAPGTQLYKPIQCRGPYGPDILRFHPSYTELVYLAKNSNPADLWARIIFNMPLRIGRIHSHVLIQAYDLPALLAYIKSIQ